MKCKTNRDMKLLTKEQFIRAEKSGMMTWQTSGGCHVIVTDDEKWPDEVEDAVINLMGSHFLPVTPASPVERDNAMYGQAEAYFLK